MTGPAAGPPLIRQAVRYGIAGVLNNLFGYAAYLLMTFFGVEPKVAVTIVYPLTVTTGYFAHFRYSFSSRRGHGSAMVRYLLAHCAGYAANVAMLYVLHDKMGLPHQAVQAAAIVAVAGMLFVIFRVFVFAGEGNGSGPQAG